MAADYKLQMSCCLFYGGPIEPSKQALQKDAICARLLNFLEGDAMRHSVDWNLSSGSDPTLISVHELCHLFHTSNIAGAIEVFMKGGKLEDVWLNDSLPDYNDADFVNLVERPSLMNSRVYRGDDVVPSKYYITGTKRKTSTKVDSDGGSKAPTLLVIWGSPPPFDGFKCVVDLLKECFERSKLEKAERSPDLGITGAGCKMCNNIMTQEATSLHFLIRHSQPLVKARSILSLAMQSANKLNNKKASYSPDDVTKGRNAHEQPYEAYIAYFLHRCLPEKEKLPGGVSTRKREKIEKEHKMLDLIRPFILAFAFIVLEVSCLMFERFKGSEGGTKRNPKPAYRYRGCAEVYLSYLFWLLLCNDNAEGEPDGPASKRCTMGFPRFHRYLFSEVVDTIVLARPERASTYELLDLVYGEYEFDNPESSISTLCTKIVSFYKDELRPIFSRHFADLGPDTDLLATLPTSADYENNLRKYSEQEIARKMLISNDDLTLVVHMLEKGTFEDIDTFIDCTGVNSVMKPWQRYLQMSPQGTQSLLNEFVDTLTRVEYSNVQDFMSADPELPKITGKTAETIYLLCCVLDLPSEPDSEEELQLLRISPMCSRIKAVTRLNGVGAFTDAKPEKKTL